MAEMTIAIKPYKRYRHVSLSENPLGSGCWAVVMHLRGGSEAADMNLLARELRYLALRIEGRSLGYVPDLSDWEFAAERAAPPDAQDALVDAYHRDVLGHPYRP